MLPERTLTSSSKASIVNESYANSFFDKYTKRITRRSYVDIVMPLCSCISAVVLYFKCQVM